MHVDFHIPSIPGFEYLLHIDFLSEIFEKARQRNAYTVRREFQ